MLLWTCHTAHTQSVLLHDWPPLSLSHLQWPSLHTDLNNTHKNNNQKKVMLEIGHLLRSKVCLSKFSYEGYMYVQCKCIQCTYSRAHLSTTWFSLDFAGKRINISSKYILDALPGPNKTKVTSDLIWGWWTQADFPSGSVLNFHNSHLPKAKHGQNFSWPVQLLTGLWAGSKYCNFRQVNWKGQGII